MLNVQVNLCISTRGSWDKERTLFKSFQDFYGYNVVCPCLSPLPTWSLHYDNEASF